MAPKIWKLRPERGAFWQRIQLLHACGVVDRGHLTPPSSSAPNPTHLQILDSPPLANILRNTWSQTLVNNMQHLEGGYWGCSFSHFQIFQSKYHTSKFFAGNYPTSKFFLGPFPHCSGIPITHPPPSGIWKIRPSPKYISITGPPLPGHIRSKHFILCCIISLLHYLFSSQNMSLHKTEQIYLLKHFIAQNTLRCLKSNCM